MNSTSLAKVFNGVLCTALLALGLTACTSVTTGGTRTSTHQINPLIAQAAERLANQNNLTGQAKTDNHREIERIIAGLDNATLSSEAGKLMEGDPLYNYLGRELLRRGLSLPRPLDNEGNWRFDAGNRPPADRDGYRPPRKLAVLLPLTGTMAVAASPVRDGLLAGYYGEHRPRPDIVFYDTVSTPTGAIEAYRKAVADGADYVVGPLGRDQVEALFKQPGLDVPVLALNRGPDAPPNGHASFALTPEDEGIAAADLLLSRNTRRVLVLYGDDDNMSRSVSAFRDQFLSRGGTVVGTLAVADKPLDGTEAIRAAAQKEGGVDAVFLAVKGNQARALVPQLILADLASKPRVATSQLLSGTGKADEDSLLDGIAFPTESWSVRGVAGLPSAVTTGQTLATARGPAAKLFAFGYDAWLLTGYLERIANRGNNTIEGATGTLDVDGFGNIVRIPAWSTFSHGEVIALGRSGG